MITKQHGKMKSTTTQIQTQTLIKTFRGNTHCLITEKYAGNLDDLETKIKDFIFKKEGIPQSLQRLALDITQEPYICRLSLNGGLRGGKGGFATLLKGQSKQAGAKMTTSYGACRDLSGRRLRHVNDEIRLRKWREAKRRREAGLPVDEVADSRTRSGISGWHLAVPGWSDVQISDKQVKASERRLRREIDWKSREEKQRIAQKEAKKMAQEQTVLSYATVGRHIGEDNDDNVAFGFQMDKAIAMGMKKANAGAAKSNNRKRSSPEKETKASLAAASEHSMSWLGSLSGEVVEGREEDVIQELHRKSDDATKQVDNLTIVQSKSEFATGCILTPNNLCQGRWYYEVILQTAGVAQIGWANDQFTADSSNGDGVGDDGNSWGYDGFRQLKFHNSVISEYGDEWKSGDCIGCLYDGDKGMLSYYVNGKEIGDAFTLKSNNSDKKGGVTNALYPAFSLNEEEILGVRVGPFFEYMPKVSRSQCIGVECFFSRLSAIIHIILIYLSLTFSISNISISGMQRCERNHG